MQTISHTLQYGRHQLVFDLIFCNRKSLEIAVHPDKSIIVKAPIGSVLQNIIERVKKRARWIIRQLEYFTQFEPRTPKRMYIPGESHLYLGRSYRIKFEESETHEVLLKNGRFLIKAQRPSPISAKKMMNDWYEKKSEMHFSNIFDELWSTFEKYGYHKPTLKFRHMQKRWGSLTTSGALTLNKALIKAPRECIEYVVMHELCHLAHHDHSSEFFTLLETHLPDWQRRKHKLEASLV